MPLNNIPEWVQVWLWARTHRRPVETRPFPQQDSHQHNPSMTWGDYHGLVAEWKTTEPVEISSIAQIVKELAA